MRECPRAPGRNRTVPVAGGRSVQRTTGPAGPRPGAHADRVEIVYGFDPLCGWCYGFAPAFARVREELDGEVVFRVATGGLVSGERRRALRHDADYLRAGLARVRDVTGVAPGPGFEDLLRRGEWVSDSEPVTRAMWTARELAGDGAAIALGTALSRAFYGEGREPDDPAVLGPLADALGLDGLLERWTTDEARRGTAQWWADSRAAGLETYPSLLLDTGTGGPWRPLVVGPAPAAEVVGRIRAALAGDDARSRA